MKRRERLVAGFYGAVVGAFVGFWIAVVLVLAGIAASGFKSIAITVGLTASCRCAIGYRFGPRPIEIATWILDCLP